MGLKILSQEELAQERERLSVEFKEEFNTLYDGMLEYFKRLENFMDGYEVEDEDMIDLYNTVEKMLFG